MGYENDMDDWHDEMKQRKVDNEYNLLHINPGAAGKEGFHQMRTIILLEIDESKIINLEVVELGKRAKII